MESSSLSVSFLSLSSCAVTSSVCARRFSKVSPRYSASACASSRCSRMRSASARRASALALVSFFIVAMASRSAIASPPTLATMVACMPRSCSSASMLARSTSASASSLSFSERSELRASPVAFCSFVTAWRRSWRAFFAFFSSAAALPALPAMEVCCLSAASRELISPLSCSTSARAAYTAARSASMACSAASASACMAETTRCSAASALSAAALAAAVDSLDSFSSCRARALVLAAASFSCLIFIARRRSSSTAASASRTLARRLSCTARSARIFASYSALFCSFSLFWLRTTAPRAPAPTILMPVKNPPAPLDSSSTGAAFTSWTGGAVAVRGAAPPGASR
mmetsp:Transcript_42435/g.135991  ORF Transcript_42435/g.135991 Transcript_42435/m.135991 type:complete len:344 (+) Transcript_42435:130-1161(+)